MKFGRDPDNPDGSTREPDMPRKKKRGGKRKKGRRGKKVGRY